LHQEEDMTNHCWPRVVKRFTTVLAIIGMVWTCLACSDDKDDGSGACDTACKKIASMCDSFPESDCVFECNGSGEGDRAIMVSCSESSDTCDAYQQCVAQAWQNEKDGG
jgi:hypothetical protein